MVVVVGSGSGTCSGSGIGKRSKHMSCIGFVVRVLWLGLLKLAQTVFSKAFKVADGLHSCELMRLVVRTKLSRLCLSACPVLGRFSVRPYGLLLCLATWRLFCYLLLLFYKFTKLEALHDVRCKSLLLI